MPKHTDDPAARDAARELLAHTDHLGLDSSEAGGLVQAFPTAEFETATKAVDGETVVLRRVVLVGPWQVVAK